MVFWILLWSKPHSEHFPKLRGLREVPSAASPLLLMLYQNNSIFWCKNVSCTRDMRCSYFKKEICVTICNCTLAVSITHSIIYHHEKP